MNGEGGGNRQHPVCDLLVDDAVGQSVHVEAAVLLGHRQTRHVEVGEALPHVLGERLFGVGLRGGRTDFLDRELPDYVPDGSLFVGEIHTRVIGRSVEKVASSRSGQRAVSRAN